MAAVAILDFQIFEILTVGTVTRAILRHHAKFCGDVVIFQFFQDGDRTPSWICDAHVWTTHEGLLVVFITV